MDLKITKEKVLEAAAKCKQSEETLKTLFPECFDNKLTLLTTSDGYNLSDGDNYFTVCQKDAFVRESLVKSGTCYASDWAHLRFKHQANADKYAYENNKIKFSLLEIEHACNHANIQEEDIKRLLDFFEKRIK